MDQHDLLGGQQAALQVKSPSSSSSSYSSLLCNTHLNTERES
jgi:hypothetical protein